MFLPTAAHPSPSMNPAFLSVVGSITREKVDEFVPVRCPDATASKKMSEYIAEFKEREESIGGTVTYIIMNVPSGLGELMFHKIEGMLAHAMLSIPATKGFEIGSGFGGYEVPRSIHNDPFILAPAVPNLETDTSRMAYHDLDLRRRPATRAEFKVVLKMEHPYTSELDLSRPRQLDRRRRQLLMLVIQIVF